MPKIGNVIVIDFHEKTEFMPEELIGIKLIGGTKFIRPEHARELCRLLIERGYGPEATLWE